MRPSTRLAILVLSLLLAGCSVTYRPGPRVQDTPNGAVRVPPGQMPPPGQCRIWFPGRPPGHQPPPGDCDRLAPDVPPGAVLLRG